MTQQHLLEKTLAILAFDRYLSLGKSLSNSIPQLFYFYNKQILNRSVFFNQYCREHQVSMKVLFLFNFTLFFY